MKRQQPITILFLFIGLFVIACAPARQDGSLEPAATVQPAATLVIDRPSITATPFATATPWATPTAWITPTSFPGEDNAEAADAPYIMSGIPDNDKSDDRHPVFTLTFDRAMDQESVREALQVSPEMPIDITWLDEVTAAIEVVEALTPEMSYKFELLATAVDQNGTALARDYRWNYNLKDIVNKVTWPGTNNYDAPITILFNYGLDPNSVSLQLEPTVTGEMIWDETAMELTFVPDAPLTGKTLYLLAFGEGLLDSDGLALPQPEMASYMTPAVISNVTPAQGSTVHPANPIQVTFNRPMDEESTKAAFQMEPRMPGALEWHGNTLEFHPINDRLAAEATFTVAITTDALDINGNPILSSDYTWTFQTGAMTDQANFGEGVHVQVLNVNGRRSVQFSYPGIPVATTFNLRRLDAESWLTTGKLDGGELMATWEEKPADYLQEYMKAQEIILPDDLAAGIYLVDIAASGQVEDQLVVVLTNHVLTVHEDGEQTAVWVATLDGQVAASAEVRVFAENGTLLQSGLTDESGLYQLDTAVPESAKIVAQIGDDFAYSGLVGWGDSYLSTSARYTLHLYTNRPIYHPGQTLYYRVIMRQNNNGEPVMLPANTPIHVEVWNNEGTAILTADLSSSHFGTAFGQFDLADNLAAGRYYLAIEVDDEITSQRFDVAPAPAANIVTVTADKKMYVRDETMHITVEAKSRDGQPLTNAEVTFKLFETGNAEGCFGTPAFNDEWYDSYRDEIKRRTDENGRVTFNLKAEMGYNSHQGMPNSNNYHTVWALNAIVTQGEENSIGGFTVVEVSNTAETVTMDFGSRLQQAGQAFTVTGQVLALDGSPVNGRSLFLGLFDPQVGDTNANTAEQGKQVVTGSDGRFRTTFTIAQPGLYRLYLLGKDAERHEYFAFSDVFADHPTLAGDFGDIYDIGMDADQDSYLPGDTAQLLIRSHQDGPALLTFVRGKLHRQQVVQLTSPFTTVAVPITAKDAPNLTVKLQTWGDNYYTFDPESFYSGSSVPDNLLHSTSLELHVTDLTAVAHVTLTPDKAHYAPGETAAFTMRVTNSQGEPISAELSLSLVDEALYGQYAAHTSALHDVFFTDRLSQVSSYNSMVPTRYFPYGGFGGCGCGGWWGEPGVLTSEFSDAAVWFPSLVTDYNGEATVTITMPNTTGEWRLTARAVTADTQVSEIITTVVTE